MSAVAILTPVVVAAWPAISAAAISAAASLGFTVVNEIATEGLGATASEGRKRVTLDVPNSDVVTGTLGRDQRLRVSRDGVTAEFSRDSRV